jgi:hypothetical protein
MVGEPAETRSEGRLRERALALVVATLVLLTPPILTIFDVAASIGGIPVLQIYCFTVWLIAIGLGGWLAGRMQPRRGGTDPSLPAASDET